MATKKSKAAAEDGSPKRGRTASELTALHRKHAKALKAWAKAVTARNKVSNTDELDAAVDTTRADMDNAYDALRAHIGVKD